MNKTKNYVIQSKSIKVFWILFTFLIFSVFVVCGFLIGDRFFQRSQNNTQSELSPVIVNQTVNQNKFITPKNRK